ncbi:Dnase i-like superfamily protein, partial [Thalictrum thalictroides]
MQSVDEDLNDEKDYFSDHLDKEDEADISPLAIQTPGGTSLKKVAESKDRKEHRKGKNKPRGNVSFFFTVVYASNAASERLQLWQDLIAIGNNISGPWCVSGDFNNVLFSNEIVGCEAIHPREVVDFVSCVASAGIFDLKFTGFFYTWSNGSEGSRRKMSKIDRCMVNVAWTSLFPNSVTEFFHPDVSDHSPIMLLWHDTVRKKIPFRFNNAWSIHPEFKDLLLNVWNQQYAGDPVGVITAKLKLLKLKLKGWARIHFSDFHERVKTARKELHDIQEKLHNSPFDPQLAILEKQARKTYVDFAQMEELDLKQRTDCQWLSYGDKCNAYFFNVIKEKKGRNNIWSLKDRNGIISRDEKLIVDAFVEFYKGLIGQTGDLQSALGIKNILSQFERATGMTISNPKTSLLCGGMSNDEAQLLSDQLGFSLATPPIRYLGLPLLSSRLSIADCLPLVERVTNRITNWKARSGLLCFNEEARLLLQVPEDATVNLLIENGKWNNVIDEMPDCPLKQEILNIEINNLLEKDRVIWMPSSNGNFTSKSAYEALRKKKDKVNWHRLVWGKMVQPRQSFTCWQLFTGSLPTQDRLRRRRIISESECIFCKASRENSIHLFFDCPFSKKIWASVKHEIGLRHE